MDKTLIDIAPFKFDSVRHNDIWYSVLTLAVPDLTVKNNPVYYLEGIDINEVKEIIHPEDKFIQKQNILEKILEKIKTLFKAIKLKR